MGAAMDGDFAGPIFEDDPLECSTMEVGKMLALNAGSINNLSIAKDVYKGDPVAVLLHIPDMEGGEYEQVVLSLGAALRLRDWLSRFLSDHGVHR